MKLEDDGFAVPLETESTLPLILGWAIDWHVQYQKHGTFHVVRRSTPEAAIEDACKLIDGGYTVFGLGKGPLTNSITKYEIAKIYDLWVRAKLPTFIIPLADINNKPVNLI